MVCQIYYCQKTFARVTEEIINGFIDTFRSVSQYFNTEDVNPIDIWSHKSTNQTCMVPYYSVSFAYVSHF